MDGSSNCIHHSSRRSWGGVEEFSRLVPLGRWVIPTFEISTWLIVAISFVSLLSMCAAVLTTCFFVRRHRIRIVASLTVMFRIIDGLVLLQVLGMIWVFLSPM